MHVQAVPGSSIDSPVVTPRHDNVTYEKPHRIFSGEIPLTTEAIGNSRRMGLVNYIFF